MEKFFKKAVTVFGYALVTLIAVCGVYVCYKVAPPKPQEPNDDPKRDVTKVTCYSGGNVVYDGFALDTVLNPSGNNISFTDRDTKKRYRMYTDCVIEITPGKKK